MSSGKSTACVLAGLGMGLAVLGCVGGNGPPARPQGLARGPVAPELRIPAPAGAAPADIPLVPLPPLPAARDGERPAPAARQDAPQPEPQKAAPVEPARARQPDPPPQPDGPDAV